MAELRADRRAQGLAGQHERAESQDGDERPHRLLDAASCSRRTEARNSAMANPATAPTSPSTGPRKPARAPATAARRKSTITARSSRFIDGQA